MVERCSKLFCEAGVDICTRISSQTESVVVPCLRQTCILFAAASECSASSSVPAEVVARFLHYIDMSRGDLDSIILLFAGVI